MRTYIQQIYTSFIHGQEVQPWYVYAYQKGSIAIYQAFPTDGETNVRLEVRNTNWYRFVDAQDNWRWARNFEVHNLDDNDVVYELWTVGFDP